MWEKVVETAGEENDEDFETTKKFAEEIGFSYIHIFPFSPKHGTPASTMKNQNTKETKSKRCEYIDNLKVSFEKYKNQHKEEQKNPQNILPQEQIQQRENTER